jgi:hypothetical protein
MASGQPSAGDQRPMMHTYRDPNVLEGRALAFALGGMVLWLPLIAVIVSVLFVKDMWDGLRFYAWILPLPFLFAYLTYRHHAYGLCKEIRLADDGICELTTWRRVIRLHVNQIKAVEYRRDSEDETESYVIRYSGGKLAVRDRMTNFPDFLARLKALNPAVDLASFPVSGPRSTSAPESQRVPMTLRSVVFPVAVIALVAWLAVETLTG